MQDKTVLIIGLGSMGQRRVKHLIELGYKKIYGCDLDMRKGKEFVRHIGISYIPVKEKPFISFVCTPPLFHIEEAVTCMVEGEKTFIESMYNSIDSEYSYNGYPSCTMLFHPAVKIIKKIVASGELGQIANINYHVGQYLPDWGHGKDFYVNDIGAKYLIPFELTWLCDIFGYDVDVWTADRWGKGRINTILLFDREISLVLTTDLVSRKKTRRLVITGTEKTLTWDADDLCIWLYHPDHKRNEMFPYDPDMEKVYFAETKAFLDAIDGGEPFPNSLENMQKILEIVEEI